MKENTNYHLIADGNTPNNGTPGLKNYDDSQWDRAINDPEVGPVWTEARAAAERWREIDWDNGSIEDGAMDFSDTVEAMWVFGFEDETWRIPDFFDDFL